MSQLPPANWNEVAAIASSVPYEKLVDKKREKVSVFEGTLARFPRALMEVARVSAYGAKKYNQELSDTRFLDLPDAETMYRNAMIRHALKEVIEGAVNHEDGDLLHKAQVAWCALADLEVYLRSLEDH